MKVGKFLTIGTFKLTLLQKFLTINLCYFILFFLPIIIITSTGCSKNNHPIPSLVTSISTIGKGEKIFFCATFVKGELRQFGKIGWIDIDGKNLNIIENDKSVNEIAVSPKGNEIAFIASVLKLIYTTKGRRIEGSYIDSIRIMMIDNKSQKILWKCSKEKWAGEIAYSPQGDTLAAIVKESLYKTEGKYAKVTNPILCTMKTDGTKMRKLDEGIAFLSTPKWDANGEWIYYEKEKMPINKKDFRSELWRITPSGKEKQLLFAPLSTGCYAIDHYRKKIYLTDGKKKLWVITSDGTQKKELVAQRNLWIKDISPNGEELLCIGGDPAWQGFKGDLWKYKIITGTEVRLTSGLKSSMPLWILNGRKIGYVRERKKIWLINFDGTNPHQIFPKP